MSAIKYEFKRRYEAMEPSQALLRRTQAAMNSAVSRRRTRNAAVIALVAAALVCAIAVLIPLRGGKDNIQPVTAQPTTIVFSQSGGGLGASDSCPVISENGVTLTITDFGISENSLYANWTVSSERKDVVYYTLAYSVEYNGQSDVYRYLSGSSRTSDVWEIDPLMQMDIPQFVMLSPENASYNGELALGFHTAAPEGQFALTLHLLAYTAVDAPDGLADYGTQPTEYSADRRTYVHIYNAAPKSFLTLNTPAYQSVLLSKRTPEEEDSIQDYQDYLDSMSESGLFTLVADKTVRLETDEIVYPEKYEYTDLTFELPDRTVQIEHFVATDDVVTLDYQVVMHDVPYTETEDDRYKRSLFYLLDQDGRFIATAMDGGTIFTANCDVIPYETEDGMLAFDCWMSYALDPAREISTFIFAPNKETKSFAGEQAGRFEALYRITVPQECFAITLANGELFTPAQDYTQSDGDLEFRLTNTDISLYGLEIEWTVENKGDEPIYYYIESSFVPLEGGDPNWFFMSDGGSADYCNSTMFGANGVVLSAEHPSYDGDCRRFCESTVPFPDGTFTLTLHAFRAVGEPEWDENENNETFSFTDGLHTKALVSEEYLGLLPENIDFDDVQPYREALTGSGLFEQVAVLEHTLELPAFSEVSQVSFSDIAFDFDGRHFRFNLIDISASGVDIQYTTKRQNIPTRPI